MINRLRENYTQVDNQILNNKDLSLKAKGLYAFLCSKPDDWEFSYNWLTFQLQEGEKALRSAVKELVEIKILLRTPKRDENNNFAGWDWIINPTEKDLENLKDPFRKLPTPEVAKTGTSQNGDEISNNKTSKTKLNNNNNNNICEFENFWIIYKRKIDKGRAEKSFNRLTAQEKILAVAGAKKWAEKWETEKTDLEFIPHPTTWLNNKRWEAEIIINTKTKTNYERDYSDPLRGL